MNDVRSTRSGARILFALTLGLAVLSISAWAERPRVYALTGATVVVAPGTTLESATVVLRDGLIEAVGSDVVIPPDAVEIDVEGQWIYAGLIDADGSIAASRKGSPSESRNPGGSPRGAGAPSARPGAVHPLSKVQAEARARDALLPFESDGSREMSRLRDQGFTAVLAAPRSGLFRGRSAVILLLEDTPVADLLLRDDVAQHAAFERAGFGQGYPTSLMGAVAGMRQTFLDAERFAVWTARYRDDPSGMTRPPFHATYEALQAVLDGQQPFIVHTDSPDDTLLADRIAREFDLDLIVAASGHEWEIADRMATAGRTLILPIKFPDKPEVDEDDDALAVTSRTMRRYLEAAAGPGRLNDAGVPFALSARDLGSSADFHKNMVKIVDRGLPEEVALASLTTVPARILGLERTLGTIESGKIANLVVADGPLFAEKTKVRRVFVDGIDHEVKVKEKPKGDPDAVVDPRGTWSVTFEMGSRTIEREWIIRGERGDYGGDAETRDGTVKFDDVQLEGNSMTVTFPARGGRGSSEVTVIIGGDEFKGTAEMGPRSVPVKGSRVSGPEGATR